MRFSVETGEPEGFRIDVSRDWFTGAFKVLANGELMAGDSPFSPFTHFSFGKVRRYEFKMRTQQLHTVVIELERPRWFGGARPQTYRVFFDGRLLREQTGY